MLRIAALLIIQLSSRLVLGAATMSSGMERALLSNQPVDCLIQLGKPITAQSEASADRVSDLMQFSQAAQARVMDTIKEYQKQGKVDYVNSYFVSNTVALKAQPEVVEALRTLPEVEEISENRKFKAKVNFLNDKSAIVAQNLDWKPQTHWSVKYIEADLLENSIYENASKLVYANADTGVEFNHPALITNYIGYRGASLDHNYAWWDANKRANVSKPNLLCGVDSKVPCDDNNHGTHTMSTVVGQFGLGVSPTTKWMACKNMDMNFGSPESYLGCLQFFLAPTDLNGTNPKPELRPHVIGNSYGCPPEEGCSSTTFKYAINTLRESGIFISVSAGNEGRLGCSSITSPPATDPGSFSVAASSYMTNERASFSSMGPVSDRNSLALDVAAPGVNITGAVRGGKYDSYMGTSMASPHVSGAALLIMAACPNLERKVELIEKLLRDTATGVGAKMSCGGEAVGKVPNNEMGYGVINVRKAIESCKKYTTRVARRYIN